MDIVYKKENKKRVREILKQIDNLRDKRYVLQFEERKLLTELEKIVLSEI